MSDQKVTDAGAQSTALSVVQPKNITVLWASEYGMEATDFYNTVVDTCFPGKPTKSQWNAFVLVGRAFRLNPIRREIYAFPSKGGGIIPVVGVDGWARIINEHPQFDGMEFEELWEIKEDGVRRLESATCTLYRKDRSHPTKITEYMSECVRSTDPWRTHPARMLRHKAMIQCARLAFSFSGIYDEDEAERVRVAEASVRVVENSAQDLKQLTAKIEAERVVDEVQEEFAGSVEEPELSDAKQ